MAEGTRMTTEERIEEIQARTEAATGGPWVAGPTPGYLMAMQDEHGMGLPLTIRAPEVHTEEIATVWVYCLPTEANAEFIAHAREDIPWLLAETARIREQFEAIREEKQIAVGSAAANSRLLDESRAEAAELRAALGAYRSALRCNERESDQLRAMGDSALAPSPETPT